MALTRPEIRDTHEKTLESAEKKDDDRATAKARGD